MKAQETFVAQKTARLSTGSIPFLRTETDRLLFLSMLFSCLLTAARILHTERRTFIFMPWNLFLAYIPYFISSALAKSSRRGAGWWTLSFIWLLFIPNSFYIITDLYHLGDNYNDRQIPQWFDLAMILSYVWNGLLLGVLSVRQMERVLLPRQSLRNELLFLYPVMWLNALGVYVGRYLRYNSWDVVTDPFQLLRDIAVMVIHPLRHQNTWDMVFCFSILMTLIYLMMKKISKTLT
jgi:uncharacterized membrane protein